ncbi:MAG: AsnC family transcriptional regulator [Solirubrobacterales bacterium]|nr:AsnC family transcriptional regulator [Solirubrobacterales bacterium]
MPKDQRSIAHLAEAQPPETASRPPDATARPLDVTNRRILAELQADGRLSLAELGRRVGLSAPAVGERLAGLEADGTIRGYRAEIDPRRLGLALSAVIRVRPAPGQLENVAAAARATPEVVACDRITGEDCYLLRAHLRDVDHLERVIDRFVALGQTTTSIVQSSPVAARAIALEG